MRAKRSTTHLSLKLLAKEGWLAGVVERFIPYINIRKDLFGFIDVIAVKGNTTLAVQVCSMTGIQPRLQKIKAEPNSLLWLQSPTREIQIHGWGLQGKAGERKRLTCRRIYVERQNGAWLEGKRPIDGKDYG